MRQRACVCACVCVCVEYIYRIYIIYIYIIYIYIYIVEEGLDGHGLLLLRVSRVYAIVRQLETLSNNNPCPSSPSSTILRSTYMALNTLQQDWLL